MLRGRSSQSTTPFKNLRYYGSNSWQLALIKTFLQYKSRAPASWGIPIFSLLWLGAYKSALIDSGTSAEKCCLNLYGILVLAICS